VTARTTLLQIQESELNLHVQEMTSVVQLIKALGGGWTVHTFPPPEASVERVQGVRKL
jgi:outer membrane protein TolC